MGKLQDNKNGWKVFKDYVHYRYGGELQLRKIIEDEKAEGNYAPKYKELYSEIETGLANKEASKEDIELLKALKQFYLESEIYQVLNEK